MSILYSIFILCVFPFLYSFSSLCAAIKRSDYLLLIMNFSPEDSYIECQSLPSPNLKSDAIKQTPCLCCCSRKSSDDIKNVLTADILYREVIYRYINESNVIVFNILIWHEDTNELLIMHTLQNNHRSNFSYLLHKFQSHAAKCSCILLNCHLFWFGYVVIFIHSLALPFFQCILMFQLIYVTLISVLTMLSHMKERTPQVIIAIIYPLKSSLLLIGSDIVPTVMNVLNLTQIIHFQYLFSIYTYFSLQYPFLAIIGVLLYYYKLFSVTIKHLLLILLLGL